MKKYQTSVLRLSRVKTSYSEKLYIFKSLNFYIGSAEIGKQILELIAGVDSIELHNEMDVKKFKIFQNKVIELENYFKQLKSKRIIHDTLKLNKTKEKRILTDVENLYSQLLRVNDKIKINHHEYVESVKVLSLESNKHYLKKLNLSDLINLE